MKFDPSKHFDSPPPGARGSEWDEWRAAESERRRRADFRAAMERELAYAAVTRDDLQRASDAMTARFTELEARGGPQRASLRGAAAELAERSAIMGDRMDHIRATIKATPK
jgi:hypothetical protein